MDKEHVAALQNLSPGTFHRAFNPPDKRSPRVSPRGMSLKYSDGISLSLSTSDESPSSSPRANEDDELPQQQRDAQETSEMSVSDDIRQNLQTERQNLQEKIYTFWLNYRLFQVDGSPQIQNLFEDLRDGKYLLYLLEHLTGKKLPPIKGELRLHHLNNLAKVFQVLKEEGIKIVGIHNNSICDGDKTPTLALCWSIIYHFQVLQIAGNTGNAENELLSWCRQISTGYHGSEVKSFQPSKWKNGYMLNAILHSFDTSVFNYSSLTKFNDSGRLQHALDIAFDHYQVPKLFSAEDFDNYVIDNKTLILYVSMLHEKMNNITEAREKEQKLLDAVQEIEMEINAIKENIATKEPSPLLNLKSDMSAKDLKDYHEQYPAFNSEVDGLALKLNNIKEKINSADVISSEKKDSLTEECNKMLPQVENLKEKSNSSHAIVQQQRIKVVKDKLFNVSKNVSNLTGETKKIAETIKPDAPKEVLAKTSSLAKSMLGSLHQMQPFVKGTLSLVDQTTSDKTLPKDERQQLKNQAVTTLDEYAKLMLALENHQKACNSLLNSKVKNMEGKVANWEEKLKELEAWLSERISTHSEVTPYGTLDALLEAEKGKQTLSGELNTTWKKYEGIAAEWNTDLCDELSDDKYADLLGDVQTKFNKLNEVSQQAALRITGMVKQKTAEDKLLAELATWKKYVEKKESELNTIDETTLFELLQFVEDLLTEVIKKEDDVKNFLTKSNEVIKKNKYDETMIHWIESDLKVFSDNWDHLKEVLQEKKKSVESVLLKKKKQKNCEHNLHESLSCWQKVLDDMNAVLNKCNNVTEDNNIQDIQKALLKLEGAAEEIIGNQDNLEDYKTKCDKLTKTLEPDINAQLDVEFASFFKNWYDCRENIDECSSRLKNLLLKKTQDQTVCNLQESVSSWQKVLDHHKNVLDQCNVNGSSICDMQTALGKLKTLVAEIHADNDKLKVFLETNLELLTKTLSGETVEKLNVDIKLFVKNWNDCKDMATACLASLSQKSDEEKKREEQLMEEWKSKTLLIADWLEKAETAIAEYCLDKPPGELTTTNEELIEKLTSEGSFTDEQLQFGVALSGGDRLKLDGNKEIVQKDVIMYTQRKLILDGKIFQAKKLLGDIAIQHLKDEEINYSLSNWDKYLKRKKEELNEVKGKKDIHLAMQQLEAILEEITVKDKEVKTFGKLSEEVLNHNKYNKETTEIIETQLNTFLTDWDNFIKEGHDMKNSLQKQINDAHDLEEHTMTNFKQKAQEVEEWLIEAEQECTLYSQTPDDFEALGDISSQFEDLISKLTTEDKIVSEKLQHATVLADGDELRLGKNKETIRSVVSELSNRKLTLNENLLTAQKWLANAREKINSAEIEELTKWFSDANAVKESLRTYESVGREEVIKTVKEAECALKKQQALVEELDKHEPTVTALLSKGSELLGNKNFGQAKHNELSHEMKIVEQRWKVLVDRIKNVLEGYTEILSKLTEASEEKNRSLLKRVNSFNDWLLFAKQQLHGGRQPTAFSEHIQRESGLKKLSSDLESRATELDYFMKVLTELTPEKEEEMSAQDNELISAIKILNNEWTLLIDNVDTEFKNLYESINCLLDSKRGQIEKSLKLVKDNLSEISECGNDRKHISTCGQKLAELTNELSTIKGNVSKLTQQTSSLGDITIFVENEKQMLLQSSQDLVTDYEDCVKKSDDVSKWYRKSLVDYFGTYCEEAKKKISDNEKNVPVYDTDEEDLCTLKNYLLKGQEIIDNVKSEHLLIDDLEQFAEEITSYGVLENKDQVVIAETINEVLKSFDQLKHQCKEGTNRVYAVAMYLFSRRLQSIAEELATINKDVQKCIQEDNSQIVTDYAKALKSLSFADELKSRTEDVVSKDALIIEEINKWVETNIIESPDIKKLKEKDKSITNDAIQLAGDIDTIKNRIQNQIKDFVLKRIDEFWGWLPIIQKRRDEGDEIGLDPEAVNKKIHEMKVIQRQLLQMSFSPLLDEKTNCMAYLSDSDTDNLKSANNDWCAMKEWVDGRLSKLQRSSDVSKDFEASRGDLLEYLQDMETELKDASTLDLNDTSNIDDQMKAVGSITSSMENRKTHISNFMEISDELVSLSCSDSKPESESGALPNSIRSQVADILDVWNSVVKRSIERKTKMERAAKTFVSLEEIYTEVRDWVSQLDALLDQFRLDVDGEHVDELVKSLEVKFQEEEDLKKKLEDVNVLDKTISGEIDILISYTLEGGIGVLNEDFATATSRMEDLRRFRGKAHVLSRRIVGKTRNIFSTIRNFSTPSRTDDVS